MKAYIPIHKLTCTIKHCQVFKEKYNCTHRQPLSHNFLATFANSLREASFVRDLNLNKRETPKAAEDGGAGEAVVVRYIGEGVALVRAG